MITIAPNPVKSNGSLPINYDVAPAKLLNALTVVNILGTLTDR
jgi:hypothetical protein